MEFLGNLGIDIKLLIAQIINFGLLLIVLSLFVYKPIMKRIEKDEKILKEAQTEKKKIQQQQEAFAARQLEERKRSRRRSKEIIAEAERIAEEIRKRARTETEQEKKAVIKQIRSRLDDINNAKKADH